MYLIAIIFNTVSKPTLLKLPPKKSELVITLISRILPYSAINKKANSPPPYSTLNPETSSDSPSARSKGARLVSAKLVINHKNKTVGITIEYHRRDWTSAKSKKFNVAERINTISKTNAILTS